MKFNYRWHGTTGTNLAGYGKLDVAYYGVFALGGQGVTKTLQLLMGDLKDADGDVRYNAARSLGQLGAHQAVPELLWLLQHDTGKNVWGETVKEAAATALGTLSDPRAFDPLANALTDPSEHVRSAAAVGLGMLGNKRAFDLLITALHDSDSVVRKGAAEGLGLLGDARAFEPLVEALDKDKDWEVRSAAAKSYSCSYAASKTPCRL